MNNIPYVNSNQASHVNISIAGFVCFVYSISFFALQFTRLLVSRGYSRRWRFIASHPSTASQDLAATALNSLTDSVGFSMLASQTVLLVVSDMGVVRLLF